MLEEQPYQSMVKTLTVETCRFRSLQWTKNWLHIWGVAE